MYQKFIVIKFLIFIVIQAICLQVFAQINTDGIPFITNYSPRTYNAHELSWSVAQDHRGVMYFGNNDGILEYDGQNWRRIEVPGQPFVLSLAKGYDGTIYAGGADDFGHLVLDSLGDLKYESLANLIDENISISRIWKIYSYQELVYFCSFQYLFIYDSANQEMVTIELHENNFFSFMVNGRMYTGNFHKGLLELIDNEFVKVKGGEYFANKDIFTILPWAKDVLLIFTAENGFCLYNVETGEISDFDFSPEAKKTNEVLMNSNFYAGVKVNDSLYALGTRTNGLYIINKNGSIVTHLNEQFGLQNETITNLFYTGEDSGLLWLTLTNGITSVNISSPVRKFGGEKGIFGAIYSIAKHKGVYYVATLQGVFKKTYLPSGHTVFKEIDELSGELVYSMQNVITPGGKEKLIVASTRNIVKIVDDRIEFLKEDIENYWLLQSRVFPERLYLGTNRRMQMILMDGNNFIFDEQERFALEGETVVKITEDKNGSLWCETLAGLHLVGSDGLEKDLPQVLQEQNGTFFNFDDDIFFISEVTKKTYKYDYDKHDFTLFSPLNELYIDKQKQLRDVFPLNDKSAVAFYIKENEYKNDIISFTDNQWMTDTLSLMIVPKITTNTAFLDDQYILLGSHDGLFVHNKQRKKDFDQSFTTLIRSIVIGSDSLVYRGGYGFFDRIIDNDKYIQLFHTPVQYDYNNIIFTYSSPYFENEDDLSYSSYLEGFDRDWSLWTSEGFRSYTNLREGTYRFHVKARNLYGVESKATILEFTISPPWYRTWWAYVIYVILGLAIIAVSISLYTRKLQQDKKRLEEIVKQRTAEILEKNKEIEQKNKSITDSIRYAKRIQTAVLPDKQTAEMFEYFVYFKPKDIVSGDFYWLRHFEDKKQLVVVAADCTGHGVPGAFMSMLGTAFLNEIVAKSEFQHSDEILNTLREYVINALKQGLKEEERDEQKDGMDLGLVVIDLDKKELEFSGANNPMLFFRNGELTEYKPDKMPIGTYRRQYELFTRENIKLQNGDTFYLFSDGYVDQFGGEEGRKYMKKRFKEFLLSIHTKPINEQKQILEEDMAEWSKFHEQLDDQIVIGMRAVF